MKRILMMLVVAGCVLALAHATVWADDLLMKWCLTAVSFEELKHNEYPYSSAFAIRLDNGWCSQDGAQTCSI